VLLLGEVIKCMVQFSAKGFKVLKYNCEEKFFIVVKSELIGRTICQIKIANAMIALHSFGLASSL
jgi:hypothetical protein